MSIYTWLVIGYFLAAVQLVATIIWIRRQIRQIERNVDRAMWAWAKLYYAQRDGWATDSDAMER